LENGTTLSDADVLVIERAAGTSEREMCKVWTDVLSQCCSGSGRPIIQSFAAVAKMHETPASASCQGAAAAASDEQKGASGEVECDEAEVPESIVELRELHYFKKAQDIQPPSQPLAKRGRRTVAAATIVADQPNQVPVIEVRSDLVSVPWLKLACDAVQRQIWEMEFGKAPHPVSVDIFSEKPKVLASKKLDPDSPLMFAGEVHWQRNSPCFKVDETGNTVMVLPLYLSGYRNNSIGSEVVVPSWLARNTLVAGEKPNMDMHYITVAVSLDHIKLNDQPCKSLSVSLPCLKPSNNPPSAQSELLYSCPTDLISASSGGGRKRGRGNGPSSAVADELADLLGPMACVKECKENLEDVQPAGKEKPKARAKAKKEVEHLLK
jgi:hypothetical protein